MIKMIPLGKIEEYSTPTNKRLNIFIDSSLPDLGRQAFFNIG